MSKRATGFALDLTLPATRVKTTITRELERGALVALFAAPISDVGRYGDTYINLYVRTGGLQRTAGQVCLVSDYVYEAHCASWDGNYPLMPNSFLVCEGWSNTALTVRISGTIDSEG